MAIATIVVSVAQGPGDLQALRLIGAAIGFLALPLAFLPIFTLKRHGSPAPGESYMQTATVVDVGLFSVVRHPQYLAYILFMLTFGLLAQSALATVLSALAVALLYLTAILEERECSEKLGQDYLDYLRAVPRFNLPLGIVRRLGREG